MGVKRSFAVICACGIKLIGKYEVQMPDLPSGLSITISRGALFDYGDSWFHSSSLKSLRGGRNDVPL